MSDHLTLSFLFLFMYTSRFFFVSFLCMSWIYAWFYVHTPTLVQFFWNGCIIIIMSFLCLIFFLFLLDMSFSLVLIMSFCPVSIYYHTGLC